MSEKPSVESVLERGLFASRWLMAPIERPPLPALDGYHAKLLDRPGFKAHGANGEP